MVAGEDGQHGHPEEVVLQPAQGQEQDFCAPGRRHAARSGQSDRQAPGRHRAGRVRHEPPLGGDASLNAAIREDGDSGEWQDRLVDEFPDQETTLAASEEFDNRRKTLSSALTVLNKRERRIFETRRLAEEKITLVELAEEFGVSRERVRQIEVGAFAKVQNAVKLRVAAMATPAPL